MGCNSPGRLAGRSSLTAIGASVCCVGPLVLLALGVGGTWVGALTMMGHYAPLHPGLTLLFLGLAFRKLYLVPQVCTPGTPLRRSAHARATATRVLDRQRAAARTIGRAVARPLFY